MNADNLEDIIVVYSDGFLELLLNQGGVFRKKQKIAYLPDLSARGVDFGDFTGDKYGDILSLDHSGSLILVDNTSRRLGEKFITLTSGARPPQKVTQYKIYDMDNDTRDDIVYLTESGELGILYGTPTGGVFDPNILESNLGIQLSPTPEKAGGAIRASVVPRSLPSNTTSGTGVDEGVLHDEVFYQRRVNAPTTDPLVNTDTTQPGGATIVVNPSLADTLVLKYFPDPNVPIVSPVPVTNPPLDPNPPINADLYVRSEYAPAYGLDISKRYTNLSSSTLHGGDRIQAEITIKNTNTTIAKDIEYLDVIPKVFELPDNPLYKVILGGSNQERTLSSVEGEDYEIYMRGVDIPPGQTLTLTYELKALSASYGEMIVDRLEGGLAGDDLFGDVGFKTSNTCGADMILWASTAVRSYLRGTKNFDPAELPPSLVPRLEDADGNGVPDSMENMSLADRQNEYKTMGNQTSLSQAPLVNTTLDPSGGVLSIGLTPGAEQEIDTTIKNLADGLACGFGGGGCLALPINWAPLAPGNALSVMGNPVGQSPSVDQGIPIFSALTGIPIYGTWGCFAMPAVWPISPIGYESTCSTNTSNAGGLLGTTSTQNFLRIFVTPTLTLGMGTAICMGPASTTGKNPLYPLISYGNCIVLTKSLPVCKGDGSSLDGSVKGISGLGSTTNAWNANSCTMTTTKFSQAQSDSMTQEILTYLKSPNTTRLNAIYESISKRGGRGIDLGGPVFRMDDGSTSGTMIDIGIDTTKPLASYNIVKVKNRRIAGFPEFIMDWVSRQTDEFTNKLLTLPNLILIPPRSFGQNAVVDKSYADFLDRFSAESLKKGYDDLDKVVTKAGDVDVTKNFVKNTKSTNSLGKKYDTWMDEQVQKNASTINTVAGGANQVRAVYQFLGQLPFLRIEQASVPINIPWILPREFDRFTRSMEQYKNEIKNAEQAWCKGKTPQECADLKTSMGLGALTSSIEQNMRRADEWRRFPEKIQKYITWKQRYIAQIICNVDAVEKLLGGWYRDNGMRFKKWAEFYVLMKTILSTWQPFLDLFREKDRNCSVCQNQRWDLKYWKFKFLSAVIPSFPILQFPRWPDIVLDLSDIRFGVLIRLPEFRFNINPIRLPDLPSLGLPGMPSFGLNLPAIPIFIPPIPSLPDLPDLPSFPQINLPNLPPPPKLPKIFGAVSVALNIFKLYIKIQCYMEKTVLIPEDYAGATIAQRTDRQMTLPFDFLSLKFPQVSIPGIREIRVSTHVNFELKSDFLVEFAKNAVKPINKLNADFSQILPTKIAPDINISTPSNINISPKLSNNVAFKKRLGICKIPGLYNPGGVGCPSLWLRSDSGASCTTTGCTISSWANSGALSSVKSAVTGTGKVTYDPINTINSHPTLYFDKASLLTNDDLYVFTESVSIVTLTKLADGGSFHVGSQSGTSDTLSWSTSSQKDTFGLFGSGNFYAGDNKRVSLSPTITSSIRSLTGSVISRTNGLQVITGADPRVFTEGSIAIGSTSTENASLANVGEVIIYPGELTQEMLNQVESYLALKYGITLDQTIPTNYTLSNRLIAWDAALAGVWKNNIAGIVRDDSSTLSQLQSQSVTNVGDIIVSKTSLGSDRRALVWANDAKSTSSFVSEDAPSGYQRIAREWLFQEKNGDTGTVKISYPASSLPAGLTGPLVLLADTNDSFTTGAVAYPGTYSSGTSTWDFSLNTADMQYITFAKSLPIGAVPSFDLLIPSLRSTPSSDTKEDIRAYQKALISELESIAYSGSELMDVEAFIPYLRKQLVLAGLDATEFDRNLLVARNESDTLTRKLEEQSKTGINLLRKYLQEEEAKTRELEKMLDQMRNPDTLLTDTDIPLTYYTSDTSDRADHALDAFTQWQQDVISSPIDTSKRDVSGDRMIASLRGQVGRLIAAVGPVPSTTSSTTAAGYSPNYDGIFILLPNSGSQTRLFDYTDGISPDHEVIVTDIDRDSDTDYIYLLDGSLYVKYTYGTDPVRPVDTTSPIEITPDLSLTPRGPDFFHESIMSPGQLEVSFAPSNPKDTSFRLEFFDKYLEWESIAVTGNDDIDTPRTVVDMTVSPLPTVTSDYAYTPVTHALEDVSSPVGFTLEGMQVAILAANQDFSLSAGRALFTGNSTVSLRFTTTDDENEKTLLLEKFQRYTFPSTLSGTVVVGKAYVLTPSGSEKIAYTDDMRGMPLLPGTRIFHPNGSVVIYDPIAKRSDALLPNTEFRHVDLGQISSSYNVNFPIANGYYSSRMRSLIDDRMIHAGVTLIAPLESLDRSSPVVDVGSIRIPVYKNTSRSLSDIVTDMSPYTVSIDPDLTIDADGNGVYEDDFITSGSGIEVTATSIRFGSYDVPGKRMVNMRVLDEYGNETIEPVEIEVYTPMPSIETASASGTLLGRIDEEISDEPIHIYRVREGEGIRLVDPNPFMTDIDGVFSGTSLNQGSGILLKYSAGNATLSDRTGLPFNASNIGATFYGATASGTMQIRFSDNNGKMLFLYEVLPPLDINIFTKNPTQTTTGSYLVVNSYIGNSVINATLSDPSIPGGAYLVGSDEKALIAVDRYGQIYVLDPDVSLSPREKDGYLELQATRGGTPIGELIYHVDFFFTGK